MPIDKAQVKAAIQALRLAIANLDRAVEACTRCGLNVYRNRKEFNQAMEADAMLKKLTKWHKER